MPDDLAKLPLSYQQPGPDPTLNLSPYGQKMSAKPRRLR